MKGKKNVYKKILPDLVSKAFSQTNDNVNFINGVTKFIDGLPF